MSYKERLYHWVLVRLLPKMQRLTVGQFRTRSIILKEPLPGHGEEARLFFLGINNFDCKGDRTLTPEKRSPVSPPNSDRLFSKTASIKALAFVCNSKKRNPQSQGISHS
ncbi:hypothetical protein QUA42_14320 [Microcoleus sp. Pol11C2]|uniref:hypothetical protein n=1 Tax=Microcoleus sp. Pol11C2 TaxID=3055389 RepID=UPI002FD45FF3